MSTENSQPSEMPGIDYFDDLPPVEVSEPATLERLMILAESAKTLASEITEAEVKLEELKGKHVKLTRVRLPELMETLGLESFKLKSGEVIEIKESVNASITEENKPRAWEWLEEHHFDGIIKSAVALSFGKDELDKAKELVTKLADMGFYTELTRSVHPMTLKSFVKERLEAGDAIPLDTFGVFEFKEAKFKSPRASKAKK